MLKITVIYSRQKPPFALVHLFGGTIAADNRVVEKTLIMQDVFMLKENEVEELKKRISDPNLRKLMTPKDAPAKTISLFLRQELPPMTELINVTARPELTPEEAAELGESSITFTPRSGLPEFFLSPGNPQLSDPWTRGY